MTPPFGITMLRSFTFRHHDVAIDFVAVSSSTRKD
jgi:hypothetical protein